MIPDYLSVFEVNNNYTAEEDIEAVHVKSVCSDYNKSIVYLIRFHTKNSQEIFVFSQKIDIYSDSIYAKSTSVETFW